LFAFELGVEELIEGCKHKGHGEFKNVEKGITTKLVWTMFLWGVWSENILMDQNAKL